MNTSEQSFLHIERVSYADSMNENNTFGARLEARMKELGWSMPRLGKGMKAKKGGVLDGDVGRAAVFGWINGAGFPNVIQLAEICRRLDISADYLLFGIRVSSAKIEAAKSALRQLSAGELQELQGSLGSLIPAQPQAKAPPPRNMGGTEKPREIPDGESLHTDTLIAGGFKHLELSIPGTSKKKGLLNDNRFSDPQQQPFERDQHAASPATPRRTRKN